jgi:hypothetical protein
MASFNLTDNVRLTVPVQVLAMQDGHIRIPADTKEVYVEIGTNSFDTWVDVSAHCQYILYSRHTIPLVGWHPPPRA